MALSMYLSVSVFVLFLSVCCWPVMEVSAVSAAAARSSVMGDVHVADDGIIGAAGGGGGGGDRVDEAEVMAELRRQDLQDLNPPTQEDDRPFLPNPLPPSLLLQILRNEEAALQQQQQQQHQPQDNNSNNNDKDDADEAELNNNNEDNTVQKRVFCNSFTGCGGIHRRRNRRRLYGKRKLPALVKRLFCTSFGCFKAQPQSPSAQGVVVPRARFLPVRGYIRMGLRQGRKKKEQEQEEEEGMEMGKRKGEGVVKKRLFCNGYGGCRGGKRSLFSPWMTKMNSVAEGR